MLHFTAHGTTVDLDADTLAISHSALLDALLRSADQSAEQRSEPFLSIPIEHLRGWRAVESFTADPSWIHILPDDHFFSELSPTLQRDTLAIIRSSRQAVANPLAIRFDSSQKPQFVALQVALSNVQSGQPLEHNLSIPEPSEGSTHAEKSHSAPTPVAVETPKESPRPKKKNNFWQKASVPETMPEPNPNADIHSPFLGQSVTITGDFEPFSKEEIWNIIADQGGQVAKNVTKKTTMVVIGTWDSVTSKEKRARELKEKGQDITILKLDEFLSLAGVSKPEHTQPPF